jgi:hypothetical protein
MQRALQTAALGKLSVEPAGFLDGLFEEHYNIRHEKKSVPTSGAAMANDQQQETRAYPP